MVLLEVVAVERLRPRAKAGNGDDAVFGGGIDDDRRDARDVHEFRLHDAERDAARDACVDRIAARLQNFEAGFGGEILGRGDHVACAHDGRAMGFHAVLRRAGIGMECTVLPSLVPRILNARRYLVCPEWIETRERLSAKHPRQSNCSVVGGKRNPAGCGRPIAPGVICAALHHSVAGLEMDLGSVEHQRDLALQHDAKIERSGLLHVRMRGFWRIGRSLRRAHRAEERFDLPAADFSSENIIWREGHNPAHRAAAWRFNRMRSQHGVAILANLRR